MVKGKMSSIFKQAAKMQENLEKAQEELLNITVEASSGGGMVTVTANGRQQILSIKIDPEVINSSDPEMLEDLIVAAVNQAIEKSNEIATEHMSKITGGLLSNLPGNFKFPGLLP
jgi:DNA-binding YbaB/EbfC family protein